MNATQIQRARQVAALIAIVVAGCILAWILSGDGNEGDENSSPKARTIVVRSDSNIDTTDAEVMAMPSGFRSIAHKCDGFGHRVYESRGRNPRLAIVRDKECR
jgi:hypothetical protein